MTKFVKWKLKLQGNNHHFASVNEIQSDEKIIITVPKYKTFILSLCNRIFTATLYLIIMDTLLEEYFSRFEDFVE